MLSNKLYTFTELNIYTSKCDQPWSDLLYYMFHSNTKH